MVEQSNIDRLDLIAQLSFPVSRTLFGKWHENRTLRMRNPEFGMRIIIIPQSALTTLHSIGAVAQLVER